VAAALVAFAGCGDDEKNPAAPGGGGGATTTSFTGFMADGKQSGTIAITVNSTTLAGRLPLRAGAAEVTATATFNFGGGPMTATGTYSEEGDTLNMSGGGYTFAGELDADGDTPSLVGQFGGPSGIGFFGAITNAFLPEPFCGTWFNAAVDDSGTFNVVANDTVFVVVSIAADDQELGTASGQVSGTGTTRTLSGMEGDTSTALLEVSGTWNTVSGQMSGTWTYTSYDPMYGTSDNGTWQAEACP
jgi:hypothetical protein